MYAEQETNAGAGSSHKTDASSGGRKATRSKAGGTGEKKSKSKSKTDAGADRGNAADVGGAKSTRDLLREAQNAKADTGEEAKRLFDERTKRLNEKLRIGPGYRVQR